MAENKNVNILEMRDIDKKFPGVHALKQCRFSLRKGEVHALIGENGAGKSTLVKIMTGIYSKYDGEYLYDGQSVHFKSIKEAQHAGISIVHQELNMMNDLTVAQNIFIGRESKGFFCSDAQINKKTEALIQEFDIHVKPTDLLKSLTVGKAQMVEIARAMSYDSTRVLILDEPTAALSEAVLKGTEAAPTVIGVLAQDATSGSIVLRVDGFIGELKAQLEKLDGLAGAVEISGQEKWTVPATSAAKVKIVVTVPPSTSQADIQSAANIIFSTDNLVAVFAANQDAVNGVISATNDATDLDKAKGKYKDIFVVGFDAGKTQKEAVSNGQFFGSVTQDPYQMGYQAIKLAVEAADGKSVADVDTGSKWYNAQNITNEDIAILLYD